MFQTPNISLRLQGRYLAHREMVKNGAESAANLQAGTAGCIRRRETTVEPFKSDTQTAEIQHSFRWSDSWGVSVETGLFVSLHAA